MNSFLLRYLQKLALCFWLGEMLFFIIVFAPRVFKVLPRDHAGTLQNSIFPAYFTVGIVCAVIVIATQMGLIRKSLKGIYWAKATVAESRGPGRRYGPLILATFCGLLFAYCLTAIVPALADIQPLLVNGTATDVQTADFQSLHKLSVGINGVVLIGLLVLLGLL